MISDHYHENCDDWEHLMSWQQKYLTFPRVHGSQCQVGLCAPLGWVKTHLPKTESLLKKKDQKHFKNTSKPLGELPSRHELTKRGSAPADAHPEASTIFLSPPPTQPTTTHSSSYTEVSTTASQYMYYCTNQPDIRDLWKLLSWLR